MHSNALERVNISLKKSILEKTNTRGKNMTPSDAIGIAEGYIDASEKQIVEAWQFLIDTGICWQLQGWFGRSAMHLLEEGICHLPKDEDPEYCDACECTPCDCSWGHY